MPRLGRVHRGFNQSTHHPGPHVRTQQERVQTRPEARVPGGQASKGTHKYAVVLLWRLAFLIYACVHVCMCRFVRVSVCVRACVCVCVAKLPLALHHSLVGWKPSTKRRRYHPPRSGVRVTQGQTETDKRGQHSQEGASSVANDTIASAGAAATATPAGTQPCRRCTAHGHDGNRRPHTGGAVSIREVHQGTHDAVHKQAHVWGGLGQAFAARHGT